MDEFDGQNKWKDKDVSIETQMHELFKLQCKIDNMPMSLQLIYHNQLTRSSMIKNSDQEFECLCMFQRLVAKRGIYNKKAVKGLSWEDSSALGSGGFGHVFKVAVHECPIALKVQEIGKYTVRELDIMENLTGHPNILP